MAAFGWVYGLYDPRSGELRYIGQTTRGLKKRLWSHLNPKNLSSPTKHSAKWLAVLQRNDLKPIVKELAEASSREELDTLEIRFISEARARGDRLTNHTAGGLGQNGRECSEAQRLYMSLVMAGRNTNTPEHLARLAEMKRGVPRPEGVKAKISEAKTGQPSGRKGEHHTSETKAKISDSRKGKLTGGTHHQYRHDISTAEILRMLGEGKTKVQIAAHFEVSPTFVHRRLKEAKRDGQAVPRTKRTAWNKGQPHSPEHVAA